MTTSHGDYAAEDPGLLLGELHRLRTHTRRAGRSWWFPLAVFGALTLAPSPLYPIPDTASGGRTETFRTMQLARLNDIFGGIFTGHSLAIAIYWPLALVAGFVATGLWYRHSGERIGIRRPVLAFVVSGLAVTATLVASAWVPALADLLFWVGLRGTTGAMVISITLLVLARLERSWALAAIAILAVGLAILVTTYNVENLLFDIGLPDGNWTQASGPLVTGLFLFLAGLAAWARPHRNSSHPVTSAR